MRIGRLLAALAVAATLAGCSAPAPRVQARPALWKVSDGDTTIWLLGSIHLLPPNVDWRTPAIDRAIAEADTLVLESPPDETVDFDDYARAPQPMPLEQRVSPGKRIALDAFIARSGASREKLAGYKDWALAVSLDTGEAMASSATSSNGVEAKLWAAFDQVGKTRTAFYHVKDQLALLDSLSPELQREMLENTLTAKENYATAIRVWELGDVAALEREATCTPLDGKLIGEPNDRWAKWIAWRMQQKGKLLIAVGLGHMAGPYALPRLLAAKGFTVERVQ